MLALILLITISSCVPLKLTPATTTPLPYPLVGTISHDFTRTPQPTSTAPASHAPENLATSKISPSPTISDPAISGPAVNCPPINPNEFPASAVPTNTVLPISAKRSEELIGIVYWVPSPYGVHFEDGGAIMTIGDIWLTKAAPTDIFMIDLVKHLGERVIWFSRGICSHDTGLERQLIDVMVLPPLPRTHALLFVQCSQNGTLDEAIFAIARAPEPIPPPWSNINPLGEYDDIERAWRPSIDTGKIEEIDPSGIVCYMGGEGYPPPGQ